MIATVARLLSTTLLLASSALLSCGAPEYKPLPADTAGSGFGGIGGAGGGSADASSTGGQKGITTITTGIVGPEDYYSIRGVAPTQTDVYVTAVGITNGGPLATLDILRFPIAGGSASQVAKKKLVSAHGSGAGLGIVGPVLYTVMLAGVGPGAILSAPSSGGGLVAVADSPKPTGLAACGSGVYWTDSDGVVGNLSIWTLLGGGSAAKLITGLGAPSLITCDDQHVYWIETTYKGTSLFRADILGSNLATVSDLPADSNVTGLAAAQGRLFMGLPKCQINVVSTQGGEAQPWGSWDCGGNITALAGGTDAIYAAAGQRLYRIPLE